MVYATGYVPLGLWWRIGFLISLANLAIWTSLGLVMMETYRPLVTRHLV